MLVQLDFLETSEESIRNAQIEEMHDAINRARKCQFAKIGQLKKIVFDISSRMDILERNICTDK